VVISSPSIIKNLPASPNLALISSNVFNLTLMSLPDPVVTFQSDPNVLAALLIDAAEMEAGVQSLAVDVEGIQAVLSAKPVYRADAV
jgi:hypothetical protein